MSINQRLATLERRVRQTQIEEAADVHTLARGTEDEIAVPRRYWVTLEEWKSDPENWLALLKERAPPAEACAWERQVTDRLKEVEVTMAMYKD